MYCRDRLIRPRRPPTSDPRKKARPGPGLGPVNRTRSPKDGLPRALK